MDDGKKGDPFVVRSTMDFALAKKNKTSFTKNENKYSVM